MASITIMIGGAVLNATAFIGSNYLVGATKPRLKERSATTKRSKLIKWLTPNTRETGHNFLTRSRPTCKQRSRLSRT